MTFRTQFDSTALFPSPLSPLPSHLLPLDLDPTLPCPALPCPARRVRLQTLKGANQPFVTKFRTHSKRHVPSVTPHTTAQPKIGGCVLLHTTVRWLHIFRMLATPCSRRI
jgi:hypothetical protein